MNEEWRQTERDAHDAKASALGFTIEYLHGIRDILPTPLNGMVDQLVLGLDRERTAHETAAKLAA